MEVLEPEEYEGLSVNGKVELIQQLIPLGLMYVNELLQSEVKELAGDRYAREAAPKERVRHGSNPGSVKLAGQRLRLEVPRVRNRRENCEVPLKSWEALQQSSGEVQAQLLRRLLYGISCRKYERVAPLVPGAIGLSASSVSRQFVEATAQQLREFQERDLSKLDLVALWIDGKSFSDDMLLIALGLTNDGRKIPLGFVQSRTENSVALSDFLRSLLDRGLRIEEGILVIVDGSKGLRSAIQKVFEDRAVVQRCQWHKRENVVAYLPKKAQAQWRRRLQKAYERPIYEEAKSALEALLDELDETNQSAAQSLREGLEETLTLHRLGVFQLLGKSLKTTNCIESIMSQVEAVCHKVTSWKNSSQKQRWLAASLMDLEPRLRRIQGHQHLPTLRQALKQELGLASNVQIQDQTGAANFN